MARLLIAVVTFALISSGAMAKGKATRFWNLTLYTVTSLQLSPAGKQDWGANQCKNDPDGTVDHDERLTITGAKAGRYDAKLADKTGRVCIVRGIDVKDGAIFTIDEKQLTDCQK